MNNNENVEVVYVKPERNRGGSWVQLGDEKYRVPALALGAVIELQDKVNILSEMKTGGKPTKDQMDIVIDIVHSAMSRNYPSLSREDVGEMIDFANYQELLTATLSIAGFKKEAVSGEAQASQPTGTESTSA